jgi:DNA-binding MarR family transcriptional regulator
MTVNRNPGVRPLEAAEIMLLDPSTVTRLVQKLQSKGLVTRKTQGRTSPDLLRPRPRR